MMASMMQVLEIIQLLKNKYCARENQDGSFDAPSNGMNAGFPLEGNHVNQISHSAGMGTF